MSRYVDSGGIKYSRGERHRNIKNCFLHIRTTILFEMWNWNRNVIDFIKVGLFD